MGTAQQELPVLELAKQINEDLRTARAIQHRERENTRTARPEKVYIVMLAKTYLLESGETFVYHSVIDVFSSRDAAEEYIDYHQPSEFDRYFIKEELVRN
jgi:hypothetical protein